MTATIVHFQVEGDDHARRIAAVLGALEYDARAVGTLAEIYDRRMSELERVLTDREAGALHAMIATLDAGESAKLLGCAVPTAEWLEYCVMTKLGVRNRKQLRELVLHRREVPRV